MEGICSSGGRVNDDLLFLEPNMAVIGSVDLDDTENVIASPKLIETAKAAGTFQGSEIDKESRLISNEVRQLFLSSLQTSACYSHAPAFQLDFPKQTCYTDATPS